MIYRHLASARFRTFHHRFRHTDLWVGTRTDGAGETGRRRRLARRVERVYRILDGVIRRAPVFRDSLEPVELSARSVLIRRMLAAGADAGVGPMAAVAGAFADSALAAVAGREGEGFVENGGDLALHTAEDMDVLIYPGWGGFDTRIGLRLPPGRWGVASSSGRFGHSLSLGRADMVTVVAGDAIRADAFATAVGNAVGPGCDPDEVLERYAHLEAVAIVWSGRLWYRGRFELRFG